MREKASRTIFVCSCEDTMRPDAAAIGRACGGGVAEVRHLCRTQLPLFQRALGEAEAITVGCTQEAPLFQEAAEEAGYGGSLAFANIRENAGWAAEGAASGPKMAALLAAAAEPLPETPVMTIESGGVALVYGRDEAAIEAARQLADRLDLTVLLTRPGDIAPPPVNDIPILKGTIRTARGSLGGFGLTVDDFAQPAASSRARLAFGEARNGATSKADIVIDLSGGPPLFPAHDLRLGYLRADPADAGAVARVLFEASGLAGTFDKPRFVDFDAALCAHSRSKKTGCTRCLDLCPTGAIAPAGDAVAIDAGICAGCGACAAVCPTGAASYAMPPADALMRRLGAMLGAYRAAGGAGAVLLFHDEAHGAPMIDALARFGEGLPAQVIPVGVNEVTQVGIEMVAAALAFGARAVRFLARTRPRHDISGLVGTIDLAETLAVGLGYGAGRVGLVEADDPDLLLAALRAIPPLADIARPATMRPVGDKRSAMKLAVRALHEAAPAPADVVALPGKAPFGRVVVNAEGCTLCLACVSACPTGALIDNPDRPQLSFAEDACVQCGLCAATCPEKVIALEPRLSFAAINAPPVTIKQEEPFCCIRCGKPFGTKSTIERIAAKLEGRHWMFSGSGAGRLDLLKMCDGCRVVEVTTGGGLDPYAGPPRPKPRTSEDYFREREEKGGER